MEVFIAHRVLDEVRLVLFNQLATAQRIRIVELLMQVEAPVAIGADALADLFARSRDLAHTLMRVEDIVNDLRAARRPDRGVATEEAIALVHHLRRAVL